MLKAIFRKDGDVFIGFEISGHAGYGVEGSDIVCAAVSSCTMLVCNCITENFGAAADVTVEENRIAITLREYQQPASELIAAFCEHLEVLSQDYSKIKLTII